MLKLKLLKKNKFHSKLHDGFEDNSLVVRSEESAPMLSTSSTDQKAIVAEILDNASTMLIKLPSSPMTKAVQSLFNSKHANVSFRLDHNINLDRVARINSVITYVNNKPIYVNIDSTSVGVNLNSTLPILDSLDNRKSVDTLYHGLIRLGIIQAGESNKFKTNKSPLISILINFYIRFLKHTLDLSNLDIRKTMLLEYSVSRMLHITTFKANPRSAKDFASAFIHDEHKDATVEDFQEVRAELDDVESMFASVVSMKGLFKILESLKVSFDNEAVQITNTFSSVGVQNYMAMISSLDFMVASIIMSLYSKVYIKLQLDSSLIKQLESEVTKLIKIIKYGSISRGS